MQSAKYVVQFNSSVHVKIRGLHPDETEDVQIYTHGEMGAATFASMNPSHSKQGATHSGSDNEV